MQRTLLVVVGFCLFTILHAQNQAKFDNSWQNIYRASEPKINDLLHTKLDVRFNFAKAYLYGKAWITLTPHFYKTDSLLLDAKGMNINKVALLTNGVYKNLTYEYDSLHLNIKLNKAYNKAERYTIFIDYTAKPNELKTAGSKAISDAKGLYFINPLGTDTTKPTQIWTQGETESSSAWFPTIDHTNQKTTEEIAMTVPAKYVTLSNGKLVSQKTNNDGTRTDTWKMDLPHSPYLFFMGVGDFAIVKDSYKGKEVSYYVEKEYAKVARRIFGLTPEMIGFFSKKLGFEYPWIKYSQMTGRNYVSGAMENTTATLHSDYLQQNARQLSDGNKYEDYISHELFHQWFGDLVTAESWSNLTLNESFANYSETLWIEYKYGKDAADEHNYKDLQAYLRNGDPTKDLVRFLYREREDMFDLISYQKGGRILNMLRNYVGDSAFFKALNLYLNTYKFKNAEAHQLRLAFEEVTGKDLNWFWNQWYFGSGHPQLNIKYSYDSVSHTARVYLRQDQQDKIFQLPIAVDVYEGINKTRHNFWFSSKADTFSFPSPTKPLLINVDADKVLLADKKDAKTLYEYIFQYRFAKSYVERREAIDYAAAHVDQAEALSFLGEALNDDYYELRERVLAGLKDKAASLNQSLKTKIETIAKTDAHRTTRAAAIEVLGTLEDEAYKPLYLQGVRDSSYTIAGESLTALADINENEALKLLPELKIDAKGSLADAIKVLGVLNKDDNDFAAMTAKYDSLSNFTKITGYKSYLSYLSRVNNTANFKSGLDRIIAFKKLVRGFDKKYATDIDSELNKIIKRKQAMKTSANAKDVEEQVAYIEKKMKE